MRVPRVHASDAIPTAHSSRARESTWLRSHLCSHSSPATPPRGCQVSEDKFNTLRARAGIDPPRVVTLRDEGGVFETINRATGGIRQRFSARSAHSARERWVLSPHLPPSPAYPRISSHLPAYPAISRHLPPSPAIAPLPGFHDFRSRRYSRCYTWQRPQLAWRWRDLDRVPGRSGREPRGVGRGEKVGACTG